MADIVSTSVRSRMMAGIKSVNTKPELILRSGLHGRGFRFRLHDKTLPGKPDIVFARYRAVIFANGCFWHGHDCHLFKLPSTRTEFWRSKIEKNRERDAIVLEQLFKTSWRVAIVWECALKGKTRIPLGEVLVRCDTWLKSDRPLLEILGLRNA